MRIRSIEITGFRSIRQLSLDLDESLTILVGENGTGKSSISAALTKLFAQCSTNQDQIVIEDDYPFGVVGELRIEASLQLSTTEQENILGRYLVPSEPFETRYVHLEWLKQQASHITLLLRRPGFNDAVLQLRDVELTRNQIFRGTATGSTGGPPWFGGPAAAMLRGEEADGPFQLGAEVPRLLAENRYKVFTEFRGPVSRTSRTGGMESFAGSETASVLLNLKNHPDESERRHYGLVKDAFSVFFPQLEIEAVEQQPGTGMPDIQFKYQSEPIPLKLNHVSSGVHQILTMVTNLVAREGLIIFIEHPETHLHPQAIRTLNSLIVDASDRNQVIIATHNPELIDPKRPQSLRRLWLTSARETQVSRITGQEEKSLRQMETALRLGGNREAVFARSVLLVEDQTQQQFLRAVAPTLGRDIDAQGVSIITAVDGEDGFKPFFTLLKGLQIPYVCLKDKPWGDDLMYPARRFFSLGMEIEDFLDQAGLREMRQLVVKEVGKSKPRVGGELGARLSADQIPEIFDRVLEAAIHVSADGPES